MFDTTLMAPRLETRQVTPSPRQLLNDLHGLTPDGWVADTVASLDVAKLGELERVDAMVILHAHLARTQAQLLDLAAAVGARRGEFDAAREEISAALTLSGYSAERLLATGRALQSRLHATRDAMLAGECSFEHAAHLVHETRHLSDTAAREVEALLLGKATSMSPGRFRRSAARAAAKADPAGAERRHARAKAERHIDLRAEDDAMATLSAYGPAVGVATIRLAADAWARAMPPDGRTLAQRRFDALVDIATAALGRPGLPPRKGQPAQIYLTMTPDTARGLADEPGELIGYGPIPASAAREAAADAASWKAMLLDAAGAFVGLGTKAYRPTRRLDEHLIARDQTCSFYLCDQPAETCDTEHAVPYQQGGATDENNCAPMCRRHHRLKTHGGWTVVRARDGTVTWTSPLGKTYTTRPGQ
ncbi:MAG TPA: DUF222 domain-containing protein [Mycobacteriales bacterium]|nr:DUF222 domain-containing protein [Mycobacteriales bacterium]